MNDQRTHLAADEVPDGHPARHLPAGHPALLRTIAWPDTHDCVVCEHPQPTADLARAFLPGGQEAVWVCRNHHVCARNMAAAHDRAQLSADSGDGGLLHPDYDPLRGPAASARHLQIRAERMAELRRGWGIPEPD